jgi:hypothetical protein
MEFKSRKIKFKAWDQEHRLLMRLNSIECTKGELFKPNHILLQFTGLLDKEGEEIYEMDVLLFSLEKYIVQWSDSVSGWSIAPLLKKNNFQPSVVDVKNMKRFCSYYELGD